MVSTQDFVARQEIGNALAMHSRGVDRADANLLATAYHADATVDYGFYAGPAAVLVDMLAAAQKASLPTLHRTSNMWIKVEGERAISESAVIAYAEDAEFQRLIMGRYLDRHERRDGAWRLTHRSYVLDGNTNRPTTARRDDPPVSSATFLPHGGHGASDPGRALLASFQTRARALSQGTTAMTDDAALDAALSKAAIHDLSMAYARGVDRADAPLLKSIFHDDATVISGIVNGSVSEFAEGITAFVSGNLDYCFHSVANEWVEISGDHAVGEIYVIAQMTAGGNDVMTGGRYIDNYERRVRGWKFANRTFVMDWSTTHPSSLQTGGMYEALTNRGCTGNADPVYAHWASL